MQTTLEETARHTVKITIEVPPEEFSKDLDRAYRAVANQVRIPGFRKGKVPKPIIDAQVGKGVVLEQFVQDSVPSYYREAVREHDLAPITDPVIAVEQVEEGKPFVFTATMEIRPRITLEDYRGVSVERPEVEPTEEEIARQTGVSRLTVRRAMDDLVADGLLSRAGARGGDAP